MVDGGAGAAVVPWARAATLNIRTGRRKANILVFIAHLRKQPANKPYSPGDSFPEACPLGSEEDHALL
jgi:hypothetical protein